MRSEHDRDIVLAKLEDGEDFFEALGQVVLKHKIASGVILNGIGMLRDCIIGYYGGKGYAETVLREPHELTSLSGNIATKDGGEAVFHVHANLAGSDKRVRGGHLMKGTVNVVNEIAILRTDGIKLTRHESPKTGLLELSMG